MIGQTIHHYTIVEKLGEGGMFQNHPRALFASGSDFENPAERHSYLFLNDRESGSQRKSI